MGGWGKGRGGKGGFLLVGAKEHCRKSLIKAKWFNLPFSLSLSLSLFLSSPSELIKTHTHTLTLMHTHDKHTHTHTQASKQARLTHALTL